MATKIYRPVGRQRYDDPIYDLLPGDRPAGSPSAYDDEFDDDTTDSKWAWRNQGTATLLEANGVARVASESTPGGNSLKIQEQTAPGGNFTLTAKIAPHGPGNEGGLCFVNNTNGKVITLGMIGGTSGRSKLSRWNSVTSFNTTVVDATTPTPPGVVYLRLVVASSVITAYYSCDGITFEKINTTTEAVATFLGSLDKIGFFTDGFGPDSSINCHWFRVT
jgi:hypothetical protein